MIYYAFIIGMKALSIRIDEKLGKEFDELCKKAGYKKNTLVTRLIASFVRYQKRILGEQRKKRDPFIDVIGLMQMEPFLKSPEEIDKVVYQE